MKNILSIIILSFFLFSCGEESSEVQVSSTPEEMGEILFKAIKTQDAATVRKYFATDADIQEWLLKSSIDEKKYSKKQKKLQKRIVALNDGIAKTLAKIHEEDINWESTTFDWIDYKNFVKDSVTGADIYIVFSEDKKQYEIKLDNCYQTKRGWVMFDDLSFKGARK